MKENRKKIILFLLVPLLMGFLLFPAQKIPGKTKKKDKMEILKEAAYNACEAYKKNKSPESAKLVFAYAGILSKKGLTDDAIDAVELIINKEKPEYSHHYFLANLYHKNKNKEKEIEHLEQAYDLKKKSRLARRLGMLYYKNDTEKAKRYFAEAYVLYKREKKSGDHKGPPLYFPELHLKEKKSFESQFEKLLKEAAERLKKKEKKGTKQ